MRKGSGGADSLALSLPANIAEANSLNLASISCSLATLTMSSKCSIGAAPYVICLETLNNSSSVFESQSFLLAPMSDQAVSCLPRSP